MNDVKTLIRDFFIENYNYITQLDDVYKNIDRGERYYELLRHYMALIEKNDCGCFNKASDVLSSLSSNKERDFLYIKDGV